MSPLLSADMKPKDQIAAGTLIGGRFQIQRFLGEECGSDVYQRKTLKGAPRYPSVSSLRRE